MNPSEILEYCQKKGTSLQVEGDQLRFNAPIGALTVDLRSLIKENKVAILELLRVQATHSPPGTPELRPFMARSPIPLSFAQERMWFLNQLDPESTAYLIPQAFRLRGELNHSALELSLNALVARHPSLRTTFPIVDGTPTQVIASSITLPLLLLDRPPTTKDRQELAIREQIHIEASTTFDLATGPLIRASLLPIGSDDHFFLLTLHHIISDGWSNGTFLRELEMFYRAYCEGETLELPSLPIQYTDYSVWQRQWLQGERLEHELRFWQSQLSDVPILCLPTDRPRPPSQTHNGASHPFTLSADLTKGLNTMSRQEGCTLFMTLLAAFQTLLHRYSRQNDLVVGSPIAGRTQPGLEGMVGLFINTLVLRTRFSESLTFRDVLQQVRDVTLEAYEHQIVPLEQLLGHLKTERNPSYPPLFQALFVLQNLPQSDLMLKGLTVSPVITENDGAMVDVTLRMVEENGQLHGRMKYNTDLFDSPSIKRLCGHFGTLLCSIVVNPGQRVQNIPLLNETERHQLLVEWNQARACPFSTSNVVHLFEQQVAHTPAATALNFEGQELSYAVLNAKANQLAHHLKKLGVGPEVPVGICLERSLELIIGIWGILKAGGAYVPLDPAYPAERLKFIQSDAAISILITHSQLDEQLSTLDGLIRVDLNTDQPLLSLEPTSNLPQTFTTENLAYLIYTSGSTGKPKGVMIPHGALVNYVETAVHDFTLRPQDRVLQFASISFDASAEEIYPCLTSGGTLVFRSETLLDSWRTFLEQCETKQLTVLDLPTAVWHELVAGMEVEGLSLPPAIRVVIIGGERARPERLVQWHHMVSHSVQLVNTYGPTEGTIVATKCLLMKGHPSEGNTTDVPLGTVIPHIRAYVVDQAGQPAPIGVTGECFIGGRGVARGYVNSPGTTATKFQPDPFGQDPGARLYQSGDLMRYRADRTLQFVGRADHQVKLRGYRIELREIEKVLGQHPAIQNAIVLCREDSPGEKQLVGYVTSATEISLTPGTLRAYLQTQLPDYMLPTAFVVLDALPLTPNGKVNWRALPAPDQTHRAHFTTYLPPRTPLEELVAEMWQDLLKVDQISVHDNFFALGGHSLLATRVVARLRTMLDLDLPVRILFERPTIAEFAMAIDSQLDATFPDWPRDESLTSFGPPTT